MYISSHLLLVRNDAFTDDLYRAQSLLWTTCCVHNPFAANHGYSRVYIQSPAVSPK